MSLSVSSRVTRSKSRPQSSQHCGHMKVFYLKVHVHMCKYTFKTVVSTVTCIDQTDRQTYRQTADRHTHTQTQIRKSSFDPGVGGQNGNDEIWFSRKSLGSTGC